MKRGVSGDFSRIDSAAVLSSSVSMRPSLFVSAFLMESTSFSMTIALSSLMKSGFCPSENWNLGRGMFCISSTVRKPSSSLSAEAKRAFTSSGRFSGNLESSNLPSAKALPKGERGPPNPWGPPRKLPPGALAARRVAASSRLRNPSLSLSAS